MFSLLASNLRLIGIGAAVIAILGVAYVVNGWRSDSLRLAQERAAYKVAVEGFNEQLRQVQQSEQISREASRGYQAQLLAAQSDVDRLRADNRGLQITARRSIPPVSIAITRLAPATPEPEGGREYAIDPERLTQLAYACQQDAEQLAALQGWIHSQASP